MTEKFKQYVIINMLDQSCIDSYTEINKNNEYNFIKQILIDEPSIKEIIYDFESGDIIMKTYTDKESVSYFTPINYKLSEINYKKPQ